MRKLAHDLAARPVGDEEPHEAHALVEALPISSGAPERNIERNSSGTAASAGSWIASVPRWAIWIPSFMYVPGSLPPITYSEDGK